MRKRRQTGEDRVQGVGYRNVIQYLGILFGRPIARRVRDLDPHLRDGDLRVGVRLRSPRDLDRMPGQPRGGRVYGVSSGLLPTPSNCLPVLL